MTFTPGFDPLPQINGGAVRVCRTCGGAVRFRNGECIGCLLRAGLAVAAGSALAGCDAISHNETAVEFLRSAETLNNAVHRVLGRRAMAQEFKPGELVPQSGIYTITHDPAHADMPHQVTVIKGRRFPTCRHCKGISFELAHAAKHVGEIDHFEEAHAPAS